MAPSRGPCSAAPRGPGATRRLPPQAIATSRPHASAAPPLIRSTPRPARAPVHCPRKADPRKSDELAACDPVHDQKGVSIVRRLEVCDQAAEEGRKIPGPVSNISSPSRVVTCTRGCGSGQSVQASWLASGAGRVANAATAAIGPPSSFRPRISRRSPLSSCQTT